ncbi:MAG: ThiF family adenylyltransferase [Planctomycetota bacterium]
MSETPFDAARYLKQTRFGPVGVDGQRRIAGARVFLCGCGALGSVLAESLVRAGVGTLRLADRDIVEASNLPRQTLFTEADATASIPKAVAAAERLSAINSACRVEPHVVDVTASVVRDLAADVDLILDGTDNFETRYLLNDAAHEFDLPWVFAGVLGAEGQVLAIDPGRTACLRCLMPEPPAAGDGPTCDTAGVIGPAVGVIASLAAAQALKVLAAGRLAVTPTLAVVDCWQPRVNLIDVGGPDPDCPACRGRRDWLEERRGSSSTVLCGRNAVQVAADAEMPFSFPIFTQRISGPDGVTATRHWVRFARDVGPARYEFTVFRDGRTIVHGTEDVARARSLHAEFVGS